MDSPASFAMMPVVGNRAWVVVAHAALVVLAGCTSSGEPPRPRTEASDPSSTSPAIPGLPGDEALTPPPPDPAAAGHLQQLSGVPEGVLDGHVQLTVAGLTSFDEDVSGTCTRTAGGPVFEAVLADGSAWQLAFGPDGATTSLVAPGVQVDQVLRQAVVVVDDDVEVSAGLITAGTSEPSGTLDVEFSCA